MHEHGNDERRDPFRPRGSRLDDELQAGVGRAAGVGRTDVLSAENVLGLQRAAGNAAVSELVVDSLYFVGFVLFVVTLLLNVIADRFVRRVRQAY